ncbi:MAG: diaminobutyrate--2-oxoglutarate transaminase [Pseudonocardiaceae bacterium]
MRETVITPGTEVFDRRESGVRSYCRAFDAVLVTGRGSIVLDTEGREYLDFLAGAGALNYGHNDPSMKAALLDYIGRDGIAQGLDLFTEAKRGFLADFERFVLIPRGLDYTVQFTGPTGPTGTNAVEAALKLARKATGRTNVIAFTNGFHGMSLGALAATGSSSHRIGPQIPLPGVSRMPFDGYLGEGIDTTELLAHMLSDPSSGIDPPAAILLETVQGEGGLNVASPAWRRVATLAAEHGALLIVDDIQAGCGRTGTFFSFEVAGVLPDAVVVSKSLSGFGLPMSMVLIRPHWDVWQPGEHNGTFRGNAHAFVTASVALRKFWSDDALVRDITRRSALVTSRLTEIARRMPGVRVKGRGMMQGIDGRILGDEHPYTILTVMELGRDLHALGQVDAARRLHEDSLAQARCVLGEDHRWTMGCANHLVEDLCALGEIYAARQLSEDTLARARRVLGDESHFTIDAANNLATVLQALGEFGEARQLSEDTLHRARRVFGDDHPRTRKAADNLTAALRLLSETEPDLQCAAEPTDSPYPEHRPPT